MIVTSQQMKEAEESAFRGGSTPEGLMEIAGKGIAECIRQFFPKPATLIVYSGKGHNGGDALLAARHLSSEGWRVIVRSAFESEELAPLTRKHLAALGSDPCCERVPSHRGPLVILDGLLGIGASGAPRGVIAKYIEEMNSLRQTSGAFTVAVDVPSGLDATTGAVSVPCVQADLTVTLGAVKSGLISDAATSVVGRLSLVPLPGLSLNHGDPSEVSTAESLRKLLPIRNFDSFKGTYGRIGILAGSPGYLGAARLCSAAAVHAGGGLVTLYATPESHDLLAATCIPEVMVRKVASLCEVLEERNDALAIGPGLSRKDDEALRDLVSKASIPCVVDADALNALSTDPSILTGCPAPRLLTPHPGEMERLDPQGKRSRREWAEGFVSRYPVTLLLKGARTLLAQVGHAPAFNSTGNPGMASGGMGDVLAGVCAALIGGGLTTHEAARLGAWICGRAAEIAIFNDHDSQESLSASSVINHLGDAFRSLRKGDY